MVCIICCLITSTCILTVLSRLEQLGTLFQDKEAIPFYWFGSFGPELTQQLWPLQTDHFQQTSWNCAFSLPINVVSKLLRLTLYWKFCSGKLFCRNYCTGSNHDESSLFSSADEALQPSPGQKEEVIMG